MPERWLRYLPNELSVDVSVIDEQHALLFEKLELLRDSCIALNGLPIDEVEALYILLVEHCRTEERLAREANLEFRRHGEKHRIMLRAIRKMIDELVHSESNVFNMLRYVDYWFERHIVEEDKLLGINLQLAACTDIGQQFADEFLEFGRKSQATRI